MSALCRRFLRQGLLACVLVPAVPAFAISSGAVTEVITSTGPGPNPTFEIATDGGLGAFSAMTTLSNAMGSGTAVAALDGSSLLPQLGAQAFANPTFDVTAIASGIQVYEYTGSIATTITLSYTFDGILSDAPSDNSQIGSRVGVLRGTVPDDGFTDDFPTFFLEAPAPLVQFDEFGLTSATSPAGFVSFSSSIFIDLNPGDMITIGAQLVAVGEQGASADALSTLTMSFSDSSNLVPIGVVPVPAAAWLFGSALLGFVGLARRRG